MSKYTVVYCQNVAYCYIYISLLISENRSSNCMASGDLNVTCIAMFKASVLILRLHCRAARVWKLSSTAFWSFHLSCLCESTDSESTGSAALFSSEGCRTKLEFKCVRRVNGCNKIVSTTDCRADGHVFVLWLLFSLCGCFLDTCCYTSVEFCLVSLLLGLEVVAVGELLPLE